MPDQPSNNFTVNREVRRDPDPSILTTDQILRETDWLRKLFDEAIHTVYERIAGLEKTILSRLDAMDKALVLLQTRADKVPSEVDLKVGSLERLTAETFTSIEKQFESITTLANQAATSSKTAIDAALQAQKEFWNQQNIAFDKAATKAEASTDKRIDQMDRQFNTAISVRDVKIDSVSERLQTIEGQLASIVGRGSGFASSWGILVAAIGAIGVVVAIMLSMNK